MPSPSSPSIVDTIGHTPLVRLVRLGSNNNNLYAKLEGNNPGGSVKDRPVYNMIVQAAKRGDIRPGDRLVEATSGNTGIAMAMIAAALGYQMTLIMPTHQTKERKQVMRIYGAELILVSREEGMEGARDLAIEMEKAGKGYRLDQFANQDNPLAHYHHTAPEIWADTQGQLTHFVSSMGTTGTITGCSRYFKEQNKKITITGVHPAKGADIPGIRKWPDEYLPAIYDPSGIDAIREVNQQDAEETTQRLAKEEGIFCGISSGGAMWTALQLDKELQGATIVTICCDRGDRYLSSEIFQ